MSDNIYGNGNNNFNPYVKKEDTQSGISRDTQNAAENPANTDTSIPASDTSAQTATPSMDTTANTGDVNEASGDTAQSANQQTADTQNTGAQNTGASFAPNGQYSMTRPQGGTTYIPPRPNAQQNPGTQQTYQRPYTTYNTGAYGYQPPYGQTPPPQNPSREKKRRGASMGAVALLCAICVVLSGAAGFIGAYASFSLRGGNSGGNSIISSGGDTAVIYRSVNTDEGVVGDASLNEVVTAVENSVVEITTEFQSMGYFQYVTSGAGSGVIISENGYVITNAHVITSNSQVASSIQVRLANGEEYKAAVIGYDSDTDIAVIKMEGENFTPAVFADSDSLVVGQDIVAIGNPLGELGGTVTEGIISALDREVNVDGTTMNLLQISAAVNPGNSGGGLFNMRGELVGIVNAKSSGEGIEGLGFAIPANDASYIAEELMTNGYVTGKPYIGVSLYYASDAYTAYRYFKSQVPGLYIAEVVEGYNDDVLQAGDRVIAVNGNEISSSDDIKDYVNECEIGDTLTFSLYREGKLMEVEVTCYEYVPENTQVSFN